MALFKETPLKATQAAKEAATVVVEQREREKAVAVERQESARMALASVDSEILQIEDDAVVALESGRELPDLTVLHTKREQAMLKKGASDKLVDKASAALEAAEEEFQAAAQAYKRACEEAILVHMLRLAEQLKPVNEEFVASAGRGFNIEALIAGIRFEIAQCTQPSQDVKIHRYYEQTTNWQERSLSLGTALREVAKGYWSFADPRDARRYEAEVSALKAEMAEADAARA